MKFSPLLRFRIVMLLFIAGLALSGITAFPLRHELHLLAGMLGVGDATTAQGHSGLQFWILTVRDGLDDMYAHYPWIAYGTDWLAFGHLIIALFLVGPLINPVANRWVLYVGMVACAGVIPLAMICGPLRGIPLYWRFIDCSFGIFGMIPLVYCLRLLPRIAQQASAENPRA